MNTPSVERYREQECLSAPPGRLVVLTFDSLLAALTRARVGTETRSPELTARGVQQARDLLGELLATLDRERGGDIAASLASLYVFCLAQLQVGTGTGQRAPFDRLIALLSPIREAFAEIASAPHPATSRQGLA